MNTSQESRPNISQHALDVAGGTIQGRGSRLYVAAIRVSQTQ
jgi:hypothetical protein